MGKNNARNARLGAENRQCFTCNRKAALGQEISGGLTSATVQVYRICRYCGARWESKDWYVERERRKAGVTPDQGIETQDPAGDEQEEQDDPTMTWGEIMQEREERDRQ